MHGGLKCIFVSGIFFIGVLLNILTYTQLHRALTSRVFYRKRIESNHSHIVGVTKPNEFNWDNYTTVGQDKFYIFSVLAAKSARNLTWDIVVVNGWENGNATNETYKCCFFDGNGTHVFSVTNNKRRFVYNSDILGARQVVCGIPKGIVPTTFSLLPLSNDCVTHGLRKEVVYPKPGKDDNFAVCGKVAYGNKNPYHLIEWIEYQRYLGASKIVIYPYQDLNKEALEVLRYYSDAGVIEAVPYPFIPLRKKWPRRFSKQGILMYNDEQVPMFDAQERLREYTYLTVIDTDEFIAPNRDIASNYYQLMDYLMQTYKTAANFPMLSQIHAMSWPKTNPGSDVMLGQFGNRSESVADRVKLIHVTERIVPGTIWIHDGTAKPGNIKVSVKDTEVVLKHYRLCDEVWLKASNEYKPNKCFGGFKAHYDPYMVEIIAAIGPTIRKTKQILGL